MKEKKKLIYHDLEILKHIQLVRENIGVVTRELGQRADVHDASKLEEPERALMAENMGLLGETPYGTPEYSALLEKIKPALEHHYSNNIRNGIQKEFYLNGNPSSVIWMTKGKIDSIASYFSESVSCLKQ